jgi:AcrR family transcriptional regulator
MYTNGHATAEPLPRGRHKLGRDEVRESQRRRIVEAMVQAVAEHGYAATTVQRVAALARVSPNTFYAFFEDKLDCFLAVCEADAEELLTRLFAAGAEPDWVSAARAGTRSYLEWWPARPEASRVYLLELPAAGEAAVERRQALADRFVALFRLQAERARREQPGLPPVSEPRLRMLVAGIQDLVAQEVRAGRIERLPELEDEIVELTVRALT